MLSKKALASVIAGTFIMAGAVSPLIVQAAAIDAPPAMQDKCAPGFHRQGYNPQEMAQHLADTFGIDQAWENIFPCRATFNKWILLFYRNYKIFVEIEEYHNFKIVFYLFY